MKKMMMKRNQSYSATTANKSFVVRVPASTANLGVGFDVLGLALSWYLTVHVRRGHRKSQEQPAAQVVEYAEQLPAQSNAETQPPLDRRNLILQSALHFLQRASRAEMAGAGGVPEYTDADARRLLGEELVLELKVVNAIPLSRGLGSSAAAIVAGVVLASQLLAEPVGLPAGRQQLLDAILDLEPHPDNVSACLLGGLTVSYVRTEAERLRQPALGACGVTQLRLHPQLRVVCVIPTTFELNTKRAREVLPQEYSRQDTVYTMQRLAMLIARLTTSSGDLSAADGELFEDCLHQPYRAPLIPGLEEILASMWSSRNPNLHAGNLVSVTLSGAGPTVLALCRDGAEAEIGAAIVGIFAKHGIEAGAHPVAVDVQGAHLL